MLDKYCEEQWIINPQASNKTEISRLAHLIYNHSPKDGTFSQRIPGLHTRRYSQIDKECWIYNRCRCRYYKCSDETY